MALTRATSDSTEASIPGGRDFRITLVVLLLFAGALALRLWSINHGLPAVYNPDEASHFVPRAVRFHETGGLNPGYFLNPPAVTYAFWLAFGIWFGGSDGVAAVASMNPDAPYLVARVVVAVTGAVGVVVTYLVGRHAIDRRGGIVAAALMAVSFLPVHWSHFATNDVAAMVVGTISLLGSFLVVRTHWLGAYLLAGSTLGLAIGTKYTAGIVLIPLLTAAFIHWREQHGRALVGLAVAGLASIVGLLVAVPPLLTDTAGVLEDLRRLTAPGSGPKIGQAQENGYVYYAWVLTWGMGWVACAAALLGAVWSLARNRRLAAMLLPTPIAYVAFMGGQDAFFGRWLLPVLPFVILLAAYGALRLADLVSRRFGWPSTAVLAALVVVLCAQSVVHVVHMNRVMARTDTRALAVAWMGDNLPAGTPFLNSGVLVRPMIDEDPSTPEIDSTWQLTSLNGNQSTVGARPEMLDQFVDEGICWVSASSLFYERLFIDEPLRPRAAAYYRELERRGEVVFRATPFRASAEPVEFNFDWSNNYYPFAFERPGGEVMIYRLSEGVCA